MVVSALSVTRLDSGNKVIIPYGAGGIFGPLFRDHNIGGRLSLPYSSK